MGSGCPEWHSTPPPSARALRRGPSVRNPFERTLVERLNSHVCSPGMFRTKEAEECVDSPGFKWDIEHVSILKPADIVACSSQFEPTPDPVLERRATEAIDRYFAQETIVPSPMNVPPKRVLLRDSTPEGTKLSVWAQTHLSIPSILTNEEGSAPKPFHGVIQEQNNTSDADVSANASFPRKLCFEGGFSDDEEYCSNYNVQYSNSLPGRGVKRSLETSTEFDRHMDSPLFSNFFNKCTSPILGKAFVTRSTSLDDIRNMKSPSISPIKITSPSKKSSPSSVSSSKNNSLFSQSTPEKMRTFDNGTGDDICDKSRFSKKDLSQNLNMFNTPCNNMDITESANDHDTEVSFGSLSPKNYLDDNKENERVNIEIKQDIAIVDMYKYKSVGERTDLYKFRTEESIEKSLHTRNAFGDSSLLQMSIDNGINVSPMKRPLQNTTVQDVTMNVNSYTDSSSDRVFQRFESGYFDNRSLKTHSLHVPMTNSTCNNVDDTKSFQCSASSSNLKWKRFDSGFHEETSTDFVSVNESTKFSSERYSPIAEYLDGHKDLENFEEFNKFLARGNSTVQSTSISSNAINDGIRNCNYSSTPSKMLYRKN